ncbi:MAG: hypothetical protein V7L13_17825 [Nostoc sp.]|uniref:hypothetical protein n=1 Tax=unclassified Nostoc TaxID=2593658 RepID=UPI0018C58B57|nr:hypothetical protein [Nostoc sp. NZL]MBG1243347.1 hypothetical protein [Nostoc sp. NZL]
MSKINLESARQAQLQQVKTSNQLPYCQPQVYFLGSLEKVQAATQGNKYDGPNSLYYYYG